MGDDIVVEGRTQVNDLPPNVEGELKTSDQNTLIDLSGSVPQGMLAYSWVDKMVRIRVVLGGADLCRS
jgi:hypothetical protein